MAAEVGSTHEAVVAAGLTGLVAGAAAGSTGRAAVRGLTVEAIDGVGCLKMRCALERCHLQHPRAFV